MSINTARMLNRIFSNTAWKLLLVMGLAAFIACFFIKGKHYKKIIEDMESYYDDSCKTSFED
jgi:hypothetical protein